MGIALLGLVSVLVSGLKSQNKIDSSSVAYSVANRVLDRTTRRLDELQTSESNEFWEQDRSTDATAWDTGVEVVGTTHFAYTVTAIQIVNSANGNIPFGTAQGADDNLLKLITVKVVWAADGERAKVGTGKQMISASRLANRKAQ